MRIGLFGGTFNPIHIGHLRAAEEVREAMGLDLVYFIPCGNPPHKSDDDLAPADRRLEMVRLATKNNWHFMVSDVEIRRGGPSYTIDTVRFFLSSFRHRSEWFLMMGLDAFRELRTWKDAKTLTTLCNIVVHTRDFGEEGQLPEGALAELNYFGYTKVDGHYVNSSRRELHFVKTTYLPISATRIRETIRQGRSIRYLVSSEVAEYILHHRLY